LESLTNSAKCFIVLENKTASLYEELAEKANDVPLVRSLLYQISLDSKKHSSTLKGLVLSLPKTNWKPSELPKEIGEAWRSIDAFQMEISDVEDLPEDGIASLTMQLFKLEALMHQAYDGLMQYDNLDLMAKEMGKLYGGTFEAAKGIFMEMIHEEDRHKEILATVRALLNREEAKEKSKLTPVVRYRNPDSWSRPG
jgi:rubrerythrin